MFAAMKAGITPPAPPPTTMSPVPSQSYSSDQNNNSQRRPQVKVFNIPENSDQDALKEFFSSVGDVKFVKILPIREGKTTTLGFVEFESESECQQAVAQKNDQEFNGSQLRVVLNDRDSGNQNSRPMMNGNSGSNNAGGGGSSNPQVKVFNIPDGTDEDELRSLFSAAGEVTRMKILPCREGKSVTLGFVHFSNNDEVEKAVSQFNEYEFNGSNLRVMNGDTSSNFTPSRNTNFMNGGSESMTSPPRSYGASSAVSDERPPRAMGRGAQLLANIASGSVGDRQRRPQAKVFGFPVGTTEDDIKEFFGGAGEVKFVKLLPIREGKDTHLGFVEYETVDEVNRAIELFDGQDFNGSQLKVQSGQSQTNQNAMYQMQNGGDPMRFRSNGPTGRIPRDEAPEQYGGSHNGYSPADFSDNNNACRRCGEQGHWAKECLNAPVGVGSMAVTYIPPPPPETEEEIFAQGIHEGINFEKYEHIPVELTGNTAPKAVSSFNEAALHQICHSNVSKASYKKPTPVQKYAIPAILSGRDLMACAQTGSGKTAAFLLPMITNILNEGVPPSAGYEDTTYPAACILAPTRELAIQIFKETRKFSFGSSLRSVVVYGGVSVNHQLDHLSKGCHILVATPGRLDDFVKRGRISFKNLKYLVLDEADRMLDMGFGPQIDAIISNSAMPNKGERTTLMFSATFPEEIQQMASKFLNDYLFLTGGRVGGTCSDVNQDVVQVPGSQKRNTLEQILQSSGSDRTLVFVEKKRDADFLASFLSQRNYPTTSLNGDRTQQEREEALRDFKNGKAPVLVATAVAARGLDINDVKHVVNYDLPTDLTEYVHRVGRTGRIGNKGKATAFFDMQRDVKLARGLVKLLNDDTVKDLTVFKPTPRELGFETHQGHVFSEAATCCLTRNTPITQRNHELHQPKKDRERLVRKIESAKYLLHGKENDSVLAEGFSPAVYDKKRALIKEVFRNQERELQDILHETDRTLADVKDIFGDDATQKYQGRPYVTKAPQKLLHPDDFLSHVIDASQQQQQNTDSQDEGENHTAELNYISSQEEDDGDEDDDGWGSDYNSEQFTSKRQSSYKSQLDIERYKHLLQEQEKQTKTNDNDKKFDLHVEDLMKDCVTSNAVQDSHKEDTLPSFSPREKEAKKSERQLPFHDLQQMLQILEEEIAEYEKETQRKSTDNPVSKLPSSLSGYTSNLLSAVIRITRHLKEEKDTKDVDVKTQSEVQLRAEMSMRKEILDVLDEQRGLVDALAVDLLQTQEENEELRRELDLHKKCTQTQQASLKIDVTNLQRKMDQISSFLVSNNVLLK